MNIPSILRSLGAAAFVAALPHVSNAAILIQDGQKIGFMGDSITAQGAAPEGYISLAIAALKEEGINATPIPAGVPGHTSAAMASRVKPQIIDAGANWMTLSCGVNDVLQQKKGKGVDLETFKKHVTAMVENASAAGVKVILLTATPVGEDLGSAENTQLAAYNGFVCSYAKEKNLPLADNNATFTEYLKSALAEGETPGKRLLADGVHPNATGQRLMAKTLIATLGIPASDFPKIETAWRNNPKGKSVKLAEVGAVLISQNQYDALTKIAGKISAVPRTLLPLWQRAVDETPEAKAAMEAGDKEKAKAAAQAKLGAVIDEFVKTNASSAPVSK